MPQIIAIRWNGNKLISFLVTLKLSQQGKNFILVLAAYILNVLKKQSNENLMNDNHVEKKPEAGKKLNGGHLAYSFEVHKYLEDTRYKNYGKGYV